MSLLEYPVSDQITRYTFPTTISTQFKFDILTSDEPPKKATVTSERKTRDGTKHAMMIELLKRPGGATLAEIVEATGWQVHTVRGAMAGALKKKLGLAIISDKVEGRGKVYRLPD